MKSLKITQILIAASLTGMGVTSSQAALIAYEGFASPPYSNNSTGDLTNVNTPGSLGFTGSWNNGSGKSDAAFALTYTGLATNNQAGAQVSATRTQYNLATPFTSSTVGTFYISWLQTSGTPSGGFSGVEFYDSTVSDGARIIKAGPNGFNGAWTMNALEGPDVYAPGTYPYTQNTTMLYVMKLTLSATNNADTIEYLVNPITLGGADPGSAANTDGMFKSVVGSVNFTADRIGIAAFNGGTAGFDEFRIGTTFADVTPTSAIPEPSSVALLLGGSVLLLATGRRRRA